ncbi:MucBP domain-containing protein [Lactobacillus panisapium]|uniref:BspA family leucine-rich repeat surface protein n=1 Tax=Lactobacillus panisapium TaxID=2012495 RepID=A0ABX8WEX9_9LACO|nr:MucBP domain-containing protein [Lactobacillus panisapium]QYN53656.1 BspA family leucine-rich repeat surface protein [Lactobacillus panisapium]
MKKPNNLTHTKGKVLFTSAAAIALSLVAANPDKVSAATQPTNQAAKKTVNIAKKRVTKKAAIQPTTLTTENSSEAVPNDSSNEEENSPATDKNEVDSSSDLSATEPNDTPTKRDSAPAERTVSGQVHGLNLSYNQDTDELSINGGSYDTQQYVNDVLATWKIAGSDVSLAKAKKIKITAATKLSGNATSGFFSNFAELTEITGLKLLDTSEAIYMGSMFANCPKLTSLDLSSLDTSNVVYMDGMFYGCSSLKQINLKGFNTEKVTSMSTMFYGCSSLSTIDLSSFKTPVLESIPSMFEGCTGLTEFTFPSTTPKLAYTARLFYGCTNLRKLDLSYFDLVSSKLAKGDNCVDHMLGGLSNLSTLVLGPKSALAAFAGLTHYTDEQWEQMSENFAFDKAVKEPWQQVDAAHGGTIFNPKGKQKLSPLDLLKTYYYDYEATNTEDLPTDTYVRLSEPITLHHVDESGKPIPGIDDTKFCGPIGDSYNLSADQIPGYNLVGGDKTFSGNYNTSREVTAVYAKIPASTAAVTTPVQAADVTVHYQDENGKTIAPDEVLKGNVGDGYISMAKTVSGYTLKARPDNATGFFSASPQSVTYVYAQEGTASAAEIAANGKGKSKNSKNGKNGKTPSSKPTAKGKTNSHLGLVPTGVTQQTSSASSSQASTASSSDPSHLPQTGTDKKTQIAVISAGAALLLSSLAGIWFSRKKN